MPMRFAQGTVLPGSLNTICNSRVWRSIQFITALTSRPHAYFLKAGYSSVGLSSSKQRKPFGLLSTAPDCDAARYYNSCLETDPARCHTYIVFFLKPIRNYVLAKNLSMQVPERQSLLMPVVLPSSTAPVILSTNTRSRPQGLQGPS
jgi:hypothetical protein